MPTNPSEDDGISVRTNLKVKGGNYSKLCLDKKNNNKQTKKLVKEVLFSPLLKILSRRELQNLKVVREYYCSGYFPGLNYLLTDLFS